MGERKLPARRKRASKGRVIRISTLVYETLDQIRRNKSWDSMFRKVFGLPDRQGNEQRLIEGMLETTTGKFFLRDLNTTWEQLEQDTYEIAITEAAKKKSKSICKPLRMRELP